jgi:hypothetical protein
VPRYFELVYLANSASICAEFGEIFDCLKTATVAATKLEIGLAEAEFKLNTTLTAA